MKVIRKSILVTSSVIALSATPLHAEEASVAAASVDEASEAEAQAGYDANTIVVSARRRDEALSDIPSTVVAVTSDVLANNRITSTADISQLVPGLSIDGGKGVASGGAATSIRGVATFANSAATPLVQYYLNDAPAGRGPEFFLPIPFDVGQIEVIKGPQGTLRGMSSPSGAISITTHMPSLNEIGGYVMLGSTEYGNTDIQGAVGVPLIDGVLAVRLAGAYQDTDGDGVKSVNRPVSPRTQIKSFRGTVLFEPTPDIQASIMYQYLDSKRRRVAQVSGPGNGLNGPAIDAGDRLGVTDGQSFDNNQTDFVVGKFDWSFSGQKLSYVGSYRYSDLPSRSAADLSNAVRGIEIYNVLKSNDEEMSHELRLASEERIADIFDYTVGIFYDQNKGSPLAKQPSSMLSGAFGRPGTLPVPQDPVSRFVLPVTIDIHSNRKETSPFANVTAHVLEDRLELSGGVRHYHVSQNNYTTLTSGDAYNAVATTFPCSFVPGADPTFSYYGAGTCDVRIPGQVLSDTRPIGKSKFNKWLYSLSASYKITPDIMVYANTGTAIRTLSPTTGIIGITNSSLLPPVYAGVDSIEDLILHDPETSENYEIGIKTRFLENRAWFNAAWFKQDFKNFVYFGDPTYYASISDPANPLTNPRANRVSTFRFTTSAESATAEGFEIEAGMAVSSRFNFNLGLTYSKSHLNNSLIPCNDGNFDGTPDTIVPTIAGFLNNGVLVARCASDGSISRLPNWVATGQAEYRAPVTDGIDAFFRGNISYRPDNKNASQVMTIKDYAMVNIFTGIRDPEGAWELVAFVNNAFNTQQILSLDAVQQTGPADAFFFGGRTSGYYGTGYTPRREFGLSLRYAFGSR